MLGAEHPSTLVSMGKFAKYYSEKGDFNRALELGGECLKIRTRVLEAEHPATLVSMSNLALYYSKKGDVERALEH